MLKLQKSSLILILIIVVLTAGCVSIYTLGYAPGTVSHKAEDVKSGTFGQNVGSGNYNFPGNVGIKKTNPTSQLDVTGNIYTTGQVTAGTMFKVGSSELSSSQLKVNGNSLVVTSTGNVGIGTTSPQAKLEVSGNVNVSGNVIAARPTTPEQLATKGYVDELIAQVEGIVTGAQPLVYGAHTQQDCIDAGGEVVDSDVTYKQCRFEGSACPASWLKYKNFSTTTSKTCTNAVYDAHTGTRICLRCGTVESGSHNWGNIAQELQYYDGVWDWNGKEHVCRCGDIGYWNCNGAYECNAYFCTCPCYANITQIGCY